MKHSLDEHQRLAEAAPDGPWEATDNDFRVCQIEGGKCICCLALMGNTDNGDWDKDTVARFEATAKFICAARADMKDFIKIARHLQEIVNRHDNLNEPCSCSDCSFWWQNIESKTDRERG